MKKCIICDEKFESRRNPLQKACSRKCNATFQNKEKRKDWRPPNCKQCGQEVKRRSSKTIFCSRKCMGLAHKGDKNSQWKGGRKVHSEGYVYLYLPNHPQCDKAGYILEHRFIMSEMIGRLLDKKEIVHHINGEKHDNRPENLELMSSQGEHIKKEGHINGKKIKLSVEKVIYRIKIDNSPL